MQLFAHTGLTLAAARGLEKALFSRGINRISDFIDYRLVILGSLLPDIIDKPLGGIIFREALGNSRVYCHTLLSLLLFCGLGLFLWFAHRKSWLLVLAGGIFFIMFWTLCGFGRKLFYGRCTAGVSPKETPIVGSGSGLKTFSLYRIFSYRS